MRKSATVLIVALMLAAAGCGSDLTYQPSIGAGVRGDNLEALGLAVVTDGAGTATLVGTIINKDDGPATLVEVTADSEAGPVEATLAGGPVELPFRQAVQLAPQSAVTLRSENFRPGHWLSLTLTFDGTAQLQTLVPVETRSGPYVNVAITQPPDGLIAPAS